MKNKHHFQGTVWVLAVMGLFMLAACADTAKFRTIRVSKAPFSMTVHATGRLQSSASYFIGCPQVERMWEYTITFMAPEGQAVKSGDPILAFNAKELMERLQLKQADLDTAKKELEKIELLEQESKDELQLQLEDEKGKQRKAEHKAAVPDGIIATMEMKKRQLDLDLANLREQLAGSRVGNQTSGMSTRIQVQRSKVRTLESAVDKLQGEIKKMTVTAPKDGIVVYAPDWDGKKKAVGDSCWMGQNVMELPDLKKMQAKAAILEPQAGRVKLGQKANVRLDANPDRIFKGTITSLGRIFYVKSNDQPVIVFDAIIDLSESDPTLMRPGMAATIDIDIAGATNVLQIPEAAIVYQEQGACVWQKGLFKKTLVSVRIGPRSKGMVQILAGLKENAEVLIRSEAKGESR